MLRDLAGACRGPAFGSRPRRLPPADLRQRLPDGHEARVGVLVLTYGRSAPLRASSNDASSLASERGIASILMNGSPGSVLDS